MSREELVNRNISRANAASRSAESAGYNSNPTSQGTSPASPSHRTKFGANLDVIERLQLINFQQGPLGDGAMRGARAIIRKWKRPTTFQVIPSQPISVNNNASSNSIDPSRSSSSVINNELKGLAWDSISSFNLDFGIKPSTNFSGVDETKLKNLSFIVPTSNTRPSSSVVPGPVIPQQTISGKVVQLGLQAISSNYGSLRSANPWGTIIPWALQSLSNKSIYMPDGIDAKTRNFLRRSEWGTGSSEAIANSLESFMGEELWQFLFNPSELEIEIGPEFKNSETWGVSDKANSGQPLSWSHNKNAQLKFNSVLLNGYVFGRQVEDLEQGLHALFMDRDGEGQDGPVILEFVWGDKVFGPCVIKNINIKEKQWDGGLVVNAEASFTLEQVPEWTINDGFVDVARPGKQQLVSNEAPPAPILPPPAPVLPPPSRSASSPTKKNPRAPMSSAQKNQKCTNLKRVLSELDGIASSPNLFGFSSATPQQAKQRLANYQRIVKTVSANSLTPITSATVSSSSYAKIEQLINKRWEADQRLDAKYRNVPRKELPWSNYKYPSSYVNELLGPAIGSLRGHIKQTQLSTCPK